MYFFFFSSRRRHTRYWRDWSSDVCSSDLSQAAGLFAAIEAATTGERGSADALAAAAKTAKAPAFDGDRLRAEVLALADRKSGVEGKSVDLGGRRIIKKKKINRNECSTH